MVTDKLVYLPPSLNEHLPVLATGNPEKIALARQVYQFGFNTWGAENEPANHNVRLVAIHKLREVVPAYLKSLQSSITDVSEVLNKVLPIAFLAGDIGTVIRGEVHHVAARSLNADRSNQPALIDQSFERAMNLYVRPETPIPVTWNVGHALITTTERRRITTTGLQLQALIEPLTKVFLEETFQADGDEVLFRGPIVGLVELLKTQVVNNTVLATDMVDPTRQRQAVSISAESAWLLVAGNLALQPILAALATNDQTIIPQDRRARVVTVPIDDLPDLASKK